MDTKTRVKSSAVIVTQAAVKAMVRTHKTLLKATAQGMEAVEARACL